VKRVETFNDKLLRCHIVPTSLRCNSYIFQPLKVTLIPRCHRMRGCTINRKHIKIYPDLR